MQPVSISEDARILAEEEIASSTEPKELFHRVRKRLAMLKRNNGKKKYNSVVLWWFILRTLMYVIMEVIKKHNESIGKVG